MERGVEVGEIRHKKPLRYVGRRFRTRARPRARGLCQLGRLLGPRWQQLGATGTGYRNVWRIVEASRRRPSVVVETHMRRSERISFSRSYLLGPPSITSIGAVDYFRTHKPSLLAVWGRNDPFFLPGGAEAFWRDIPGAIIHFLRYRPLRARDPCKGNRGGDPRLPRTLNLQAGGYVVILTPTWTYSRHLGETSIGLLPDGQLVHNSVR
jgi:hypothetical protein